MNNDKRIAERLVISLPGSPRQEKFFAQPEARRFTLFPAFDGRTGGGLDRFDPEAFEHRYGHQPKGGEVGAAISHLEAARSFATAEGDKDDLLLVAEDDAVFAPEFDAVVKKLCERTDFDFILLAHPCEDLSSEWISAVRDWIPMSLFAQPVGAPGSRWKFRVGPTPGTLAGTGLYLMTREASRKLVAFADASPRLSWVADDYESWHKPAGLRRILVLRPNLCDWLGDSEIGADQPHFAHLRMAQAYREASTLQQLKYRFGRKAWPRRLRRLVATFDATVKHVGAERILSRGSKK